MMPTTQESQSCYRQGKRKVKDEMVIGKQKGLKLPTKLDHFPLASEFFSARKCEQRMRKVRECDA